MGTPCCNRSRRLSGFWVAAALAALSSQAALADSSAASPVDLSATTLSGTDATYTLIGTGAGSALSVSTGHTKSWPGVTILPAGGPWDWSPYACFTAQIRDTGSQPIRVSCRVDNPGADGGKNCLNGSISLPAGGSGTVSIVLHRKGLEVPGVTLFGMRGYPIDMGEGGTIDPADVIRLIFFVDKPTSDQTFEVSHLQAQDAFGIAPDDLHGQPFLPFIDTFGQYIHREWPGKVHSAAELTGRTAIEDEDLTKNPGPADWDRFGGWAQGPTLPATGYFRVQKYRGKWTFVDPDGHLFFSQGVDCVDAPGATPIDDRDQWFQDFPGQGPEFKSCLSHQFALIGYYAGKTVQAFSFEKTNLIRRYGPDYEGAYVPLVHRRLRSWGVNTIGNWSDPGVEQPAVPSGRTPYTKTVGVDAPKIAGSQGYWGKFDDVFDPQFALQVNRRVAPAAAACANDPWCIGYFVDNEMSWGDQTALPLAVLASPATQPSKLAFQSDLEKKYVTIDALNAVWGTSYATWDALLQSQTPPDAGKAKADLDAFGTRLSETYFRTIRDAIRAAAPHQLYLGCRFAGVNPLAAAAAAKYCDVVSFNLYRASVTDFQNPAPADVPLIVGEFHFGALDRGMFHPGLRMTANQDDRARSYRDYVESVIARPDFVGCHWFQYADEPNTGRTYDGEDYQIGFVDVTDTPYPETVAAAREVGATLYRDRFGASK